MYNPIIYNPTGALSLVNSIKKLLISALLGGVILLLAAYFQLGLIFAPAAIAFVGVAWGIPMALVTAAVCLGGLYAMAGTAGLTTAAMVLPAGIIIWVCLKKRLAYRTAASFAAAAQALALYALTCLPAMLSGGSPFDMYSEYLAVFGDAMILTGEQMALTGEIADTIAKYAAYMEVMAPDIAVFTMISLGLVSGLACTVIARLLCLKAKVELKPMAPFSHWQLTREFAKGCLILIVGALICGLSGINNASAILIAIECIVGGPYCLMGICLVAFAVKYRVRGGGVLAVAIIGLVLMFPYSIYGLAFMGMADRAFKMRKNLLASRKKQ